MGSLPPYRKSSIPPDAKKVFQGVIFDIYQWEQELFDGSYATFEMVHRPDTAIIFPVLPDGSIVLIEDTQPHRGMILTAPCGRVEGGETPEAAAIRELKEETGYKASRIELFYIEGHGSKIDAEVHVFIGKECEKVAEPTLDPGEKIIPRIISFDELLQVTLGGEESRFHSASFRMKVLEALHDPKKMDALKAAFAP